MKREAKTYLSGIAVLAALFVIGSLMRSRESQANGAYSTPVTVMNTTANPGSVLDAAKASRVPYQSTVNQNCGGGIQFCLFTFTAAPSGFRLVVENVSGAFDLNIGATAPVAFLSHSSGGGIWEFAGAVGQPLAGINSGFNQTVRAYFDPADGPPFVNLIGNLASGNQQQVTLSGYLENCAIAGCPAIQH